MSTLSFAAAVGSYLALAPVAAGWAPLPASVALVALAVLVASAASERFDALATATGALGALFAGVLGSTSPLLAGAVLVAAAFTERTTRVRAPAARAAHVLAALAGGAAAGGVSSAYAASSLGVYAAAIVVGAVVASLPLLVEADDPLAHALEASASLVREPPRAALLAGAELRRRAHEVPLDRDAGARVEHTWRALTRLAEARVRLERAQPPVFAPALPRAPGAPLTETEPRSTDAVVEMLDRRIVEHVSALARAHAGAHAASAACLGLDDAAVETAEALGESLDEVSRALIETERSR